MMTSKLKNSGLMCILFAIILLAASCQNPPPAVSDAANSASNEPPVNAPPASSTPQPTSAISDEQRAINLPFTLPVLDAMFAEENFAAELKSKLNLTDEQIGQLRQTAREAMANLKENETSGSTAEAKRRADEKIRALLGEDKATQLAQFVSERWANGSSNGAAKPAMSNAGQPNAIPSDTRIVVNAPAYRMDLFKDGQLVKSYKIGIGYPEFPLPSGMRQAKEIIFNPTWTPPDEPWVEGSKKVQAGKKVEAGNSLNPLGPIKIPIGLPSLIHGGKNPAKLGGFASHGCVGLTSPQVQDFSLALAKLSGTPLTSEDVMNDEKQKTETKNVKLAAPMPVELRYETIVIENGVLKIYRDVYERGTNTEANLRKVLDADGVSLDSLSAAERAKILAALKQMGTDAGGQEVTEEAAAAKAKAKKNTSKTVTRTIKGKKEIDIPIAALKGKGYPAPVDLNTGGKSSKPLNLNAKDSAAKNNTAKDNATNGNAANSANSNSNQKPSSNANSASRKF
ncbi:MAG: L,D-transpeptidase family protein [Pyrinomonadaceae bacterium]